MSFNRFFISVLLCVASVLGGSLPARVQEQNTTGNKPLKDCVIDMNETADRVEVIQLFHYREPTEVIDILNNISGFSDKSQCFKALVRNEKSIKAHSTNPPQLIKNKPCF